MTSAKDEVDNTVSSITWLYSGLITTASNCSIADLDIGNYFVVHAMDRLFILKALMEAKGVFLVEEVKTSEQFLITGAHRVTKKILTRQEEMKLLPFTVT